MTSLSWVIPNLNLPDSESSPTTSPVNPPPNAPNINTCRPMSFQDEGAKVSGTAKTTTNKLATVEPLYCRHH